MEIWYRVPSKRRESRRQARYCAMDDFTQALRAAGGDWSEIELGVEFAVLVRVPNGAREPSAVIDQLDNTFTRIPAQDLDVVLDSPRQRVRWNAEQAQFETHGPALPPAKGRRDAEREVRKGGRHGLSNQ